MFAMTSCPTSSYADAVLRRKDIGISMETNRRRPTVLGPGRHLICSRTTRAMAIQPISTLLCGVRHDNCLVCRGISFDRLVTSLRQGFGIAVRCGSRGCTSRCCGIGFTPRRALRSILTILRRLVNVHFGVGKGIMFVGWGREEKAK